MKPSNQTKSIVTSASRSGDHLSPISAEKHPSRFAELITAIARTKRIMTLSGGSVLDGTGYQPLDKAVDVRYGKEVRRQSLYSLLQECTSKNVRPEDLSSNKLAAYNTAMAARRIAIRQFEANVFLDYLVRIFREDRLTTCMTSSFDGIEARAAEGLSDKIFMLYGDNATLSCCTNNCRTMSEEETKALDGDMISKGLVLCRRCTQAYTKTAKARRTGTEATRFLRPTVQVWLGESMLLGDGEDRKFLQNAAETSHLLLVLGVPPKSVELTGLIQDLAEVVHEHYGAVVYVGPEAVQNRTQHQYIDVHLQSDVPEALGRVMCEMDRLAVGGEPEDDLDDGDFWFETINNQLPRHTVTQEEPYLGQVCIHCCCGIVDYLAECSQCSTSYCYRRTEDEDSGDSDDEEASTDRLEATRTGPVPGAAFNQRHQQGEGNSFQGFVPEEEEEEDTFAFDEACIVFNMFLREGIRPSLEEAKRDFVCPECWHREKRGFYPHFVRPVARETPESSDKPWPRLALLVYYVEQFWPQTKQLCALVASIWKQMGWQCIVEPVKLQHLQEKANVFPDLAWDKGTYEVMVVYISHGLTGEQGYQLTNKESYRPVEFFETTLSVARDALEGAKTTRGFLLCCGHPLHHPGLVQELREWIDDHKVFDTLIGCMNRKFSPAFLVNVMAKWSKALVEQTDQACETLLKYWLRDTIGCSHSDLLCLAPGRRPEMWLYAPFQSRPLGRPLPSLLSVCPCRPPLDENGDPIIEPGRGRKIWKVEHEKIAPDSKLRDVYVRARCQACRQAWPLPYESLAGTLIKVDGVFGAIVPYFYDPNEE